VTVTATAGGAVSPWLVDADDGITRPPLPGDTDVDIAILGAGYTGLWTAFALQRRDPTLRIGIVEANTAGFGGSGRNGAWCIAGLGLTVGEFARRYGDDTARYVTSVMRETVDEVGDVCARYLKQAAFAKGGLLRLARGPHERPVIQAAYEVRRRLRLDDGLALLSADEVKARVRVAGVEGALADEHCATVHPGHLVRGLARLVESEGATIWESTPVTAVSPGRDGRRPSLETDHGTLTADVVVLAGEAYLAQLEPFHRHVLPVYSLVVMTEPMTAAQRDSVGWQRRECMSSQRISVDYMSCTADGRIVFGGRGAPYRFGSSIEPSHDHHAPTHEWLREQLVEWFPQLRGIGFTHAWGGPVAMPRDWLPTFSYRAETGLAAAFGYTGQGVAASNLAGRVLADLITGQGAHWSRLPMVGHRPRLWEPEPLRWVAVRAMQAAVDRLDRKAAATGKAPSGRSLPERLIRH
jgi:glycine/D-amino acid oxidase-like deaminating enzyme